MYLITCILRTSQQVLQFHFDQFKDADRFIKSECVPNSPAVVKIEDDYGCKSLIRTEEIAGIFLTDLDKEMEAQEKVQWAKVQNDMKIQKKAQEHPGARILQAPSGLRA